MTAALQVPHTRTWPLERRDAAVLLGWFIGLVGVWWAVGALITGPLDGSGFVRTDERISEWFADGRTPRYDDLSAAGAMLADTFVKIIVTAIAAAVILAIWRSWRDVAMIVLPLILEASTFIVVTWLVGRPRPDVPRLETSPVASSWPSGHTAAATVYFAIVVVIWWHVRNTVVRVDQHRGPARRPPDRRLGAHVRRDAPPVRRRGRGGPRRGLGLRGVVAAARSDLTWA